MGNPVMHFQLCAEDVDALSAFYREVFGWRIAPRRLMSVDADVSGTYSSVEAEDGGISGGFTDEIPGRRGVVLVVGVDDIEATLTRVEQLGGRRRFPAMPPERMSISVSDETERQFELAEFEDPEGGVVQIVQH